jgi:predicted AlkP superfamily pyrophosphatase or phosphodiesterase
MVFLDGVGIGPADPERNAFFNAHLPNLQKILGTAMPSLDDPVVGTESAVAFPLDATLGVEGTPQSGTGQTSLLTGVNAAEILGRHFGPWTPVKLRPLLAERNLLQVALEAGHRVEFANAVPSNYKESRWARRPAAPPLAAETAGLLTRHEEELERGQAVASGIVNTDWRTHLKMERLPEITPSEAGSNLARISDRADLTFFAHYSTDYAGHKRSLPKAREALERVDAFLGGIVSQLPEDALLVVCSDHGNVEDASAGHTRNPSLTLLSGPGAHRIRGEMRSIADLAPGILEVLG